MSSKPELPEDTIFERRLLESARVDARPREVGEAWARFAGRLRILVPDPSNDFGRPGGRLPEPATVAAPAVGIRAARDTAVKWLLLGAIGGSGLTAGLMIERRQPKFDRPAAQSEAAPSRQVDDSTRASGSAISLSDERARALETVQEPRTGKEISRLAPRGGRAARRTEATSRDRSKQQEHIASLASSTLAAEVSRIDSARIAISMGDYDETMRLIERYHRDFPNAALAPDADVVALEAAAMKRDPGEIARRAQSFLSRYPGDPHAARVRRLAEHLRER
jgi:hypothetical protein